MRQTNFDQSCLIDDGNRAESESRYLLAKFERKSRWKYFEDRRGWRYANRTVELPLRGEKRKEELSWRWKFLNVENNGVSNLVRAILHRKYDSLHFFFFFGQRASYINTDDATLKSSVLIIHLARVFPRSTSYNALDVRNERFPITFFSDQSALHLVIPIDNYQAYHHPPSKLSNNETKRILCLI